MYKAITILFTLILSSKIYGQGSIMSNVIFQVDEKSKFKKKLLSNDSTWLFVEYALDSINFNIEKFPARVLGKNKSVISVNIPDSILSLALNIKIISPGNVGCFRCPAFPDSEVLLADEYKPFDFKFNSDPEGADLFLIPLYECKTIFNTTNFDKIKVDSTILEKIISYKISIKPTPLTLKVVSQPYVAIFSFSDLNSNTIKLTKELIKPIKNFPEQNVATSRLR